MPGKRLELYENWLCPVSAESVILAEKEIGIEFPSQLRAFYQQVGFGAILTGTSGWKSISHNEIIHPEDIPKILNGTCEWIMPYTVIEPDTIPFLNRDLDVLICLRPHSENPNAVWRMWGRKICDSLVEFFQRLLEDPDWFSPPLDRTKNI